MAASAAFSRHRLVSHCRSALLALCVAVSTPALAQAANPSDWWVYVANDYPDEIKDLLAHGADPNVRYRNGQPALMRAVVDGAWTVSYTHLRPGTGVEAAGVRCSAEDEGRGRASRSGQVGQRKCISWAAKRGQSPRARRPGLLAAATEKHL